MRIAAKECLVVATVAVLVIAGAAVIGSCSASTWREPFKSVNTQLWQVPKTKWLLEARHSLSIEKFQANPIESPPEYLTGYRTPNSRPIYFESDAKMQEEHQEMEVELRLRVSAKGKEPVGALPRGLGLRGERWDGVVGPNLSVGVGLQDLV